MLFGIIRIIFWGLAFIISFFLIWRSRVVHKRRWIIISLVAATILTTISALIPIENVFITFSSPESAYNYNNSANVKLILEGKKTNFVVGIKNDTYIYSIVPKSNNGWKLGMGLDMQQIIPLRSDEPTVHVYQHKPTNDYYITVFDINGGPSNIKDNRNSEFKYLEKFDGILHKTFYTYYAYIDGFDENYVITVDGKPIKVQN